MAYDEGLAARIREVVADRLDVTEKRMFGGLAFLVNGNLACAVHHDDLLVRLPADEHEAALGEPGASIFDLTGRPMKGWLVVDATALAEDDDLHRWAGRGLDFAGGFPPK
ncbi:TfoX/Sxy family protein [Jiangella alkaliphila]|uniref:Transcriptional regulator of competence genes, TfoX/Sxy family n=1 Tax=Jiangella alkaliphila TaxID=419479 RepID=A0A1H2G259_9ACTN|nr:TfoX/Sxy family protein [Jiangella alkaliphila]SDU13595.1 Transcriptional regulator of competence genes, TfoX/Sxy family [Jiangella alkaliphila]